MATSARPVAPSKRRGRGRANKPLGAKAVNHKKRLTRGARDGINCLGRSRAVCRGPLTSFPSMG